MVIIGRWEQHWSDEEQRNYFYNPETDETRWDNPYEDGNASISTSPQDSRPASYLAQSVTIGMDNSYSNPPPLPPPATTTYSYKDNADSTKKEKKEKKEKTPSSSSGGGVSIV